MRILVCGDRNWVDAGAIAAVLDGLDVDVVIEGEARGADSMARDWAVARGVPVLPFPADWQRYGRAAGPIRNRQMLAEGKPDLVVAFHANLNASRGTADMLRAAVAAGVKTVVNGAMWTMTVERGA